MRPVPDEGDLAPDFTLSGTVPGHGPDSGDREFTLSAARGRPVVLAFYPGDETPVCTRQLCSYQHDLETLRGLDAQLWGISSQSLDSHRRFQAHRGLTFPLLSDPDNQVFAAYGLGTLLHRRAVFVIDAEGRIAWRHVSTTGLTYRRTQEIAAALRRLPSAAYPGEPGTASLDPQQPLRRSRNGGEQDHQGSAVNRLRGDRGGSPS
jgi:peroxiredoxin Q/BCP